MSYARRPMGDYKTYGYAGDPGFLSSLWGVVKKVARPIIGGIIGGPIGMAITGTQIVKSGGKTTVGPARIEGPAVVGQVSFPGGTSIGLGLQGGAPIPGPYDPMRGSGMVPSGYHYAKDGSGRMVRNRRMNVANPKALRRAMRRASGFEKLAKRAINFNKRVRPARKKVC